LAEVKLRVVDVDETLVDPKSNQGRVAAGIREGRRREKVEQAKHHVLVLTKHQGELDGLKAAHASEMERIAARERAIGHHRAAWVYGLSCFLIGGTAALVAMIQMQNYTAATLARNFREQAMTGAIIQANQEPARCIPGETLPDGRVCPQ